MLWLKFDWINAPNHLLLELLTGVTISRDINNSEKIFSTVSKYGVNAPLSCTHFWKSNKNQIEIKFNQWHHWNCLRPQIEHCQHNLTHDNRRVLSAGKINICTMCESTYLELVQNGHQRLRFTATGQKLLWFRFQLFAQRFWCWFSTRGAQISSRHVCLYVCDVVIISNSKFFDGRSHCCSACCALFVCINVWRCGIMCAFDIRRV